MKIQKVLIPLFALFTLTSCQFLESWMNFDLGSESDDTSESGGDSEESTPDSRLTSITATDGKSVYYTNEAFDTANQLEVHAHYFNGEDIIINKGNGFNGYTYNVKNPSNVKINTAQAFQSAGTYKVTLNYNYNSFTLNINVEEYIPTGDITSITATKTTVNYAVGESMSLGDYSATLTYNGSENINATSSTLSTYGCALKLLNPSNEEVPLNTTFSVTGTYKLETYVSANPSVKHDLDITVTEYSPIEKTTIQYNYKNYIEDNFYTLDQCPTTGNPKLLIIPVWLNDSGNYINSSYKDNVRADIQAAYLGSTSDTGWHSVKTYYELESHNAVHLNGVVTDWYSVNATKDEVIQLDQNDKDDYVINNEKATVSLVKILSDRYFSESGANRKDFDSDGNGYLDGVMLIYAAPDYGTKNSTNGNLWAYCFWVQNILGSNPGNKNNPTANVFFWASYDFMYGSNTATSRTGHNYAGGDTNYASIDTHTYIHEMGHVFGLEDYYDYSQQYNPAGGYSMQDLNIGGHDPFSIMALGWANPYIPTNSTTIQLREFTSSGDLILLTPSWNSYNSVFDEYLLLELYAPINANMFDAAHKYKPGYTYPQGPVALGVRLWHVDARLTDYHGPSDNDYSASRLFNKKTNQCIGGITMAMSNTYYDSQDLHDSNDRVSGFGSDYNVLQLIRNSTSATYRPTDDLSSNVLWPNSTNSTFNISNYSSQFVNGTNLNSGVAFPWSFTVSITGTGTNVKATVVLTKA